MLPAHTGAVPAGDECVPCSVPSPPAAQHRQPPPSWQPAPGCAGSHEITHGAALPNTYSAAGRIPPPSCCSPSPPRSQPPPGPAPSPQKRSSGARAPRPARLLQQRNHFAGRKKNGQDPPQVLCPFLVCFKRGWHNLQHRQSALKTVVTQCQAHWGISGVRSLPTRPEQTPRCRLCLNRARGAEHISEGLQQCLVKEIGAEEQPEGRKNIPEKTQANETAEEPRAGSAGYIPPGCPACSEGAGRSPGPAAAPAAFCRQTQLGSGQLEAGGGLPA